MSSPPKKSSGKSGAVALPAWHPDFRMLQRLPDTKPVRTIFFINSAAVFLAAALALYIGYYEIGLRALRVDTENAVRTLENNKPASDQAVALFAKFKDQEARILALQEFLAPRKLALPELILHLGSFLPPGVRLTSVDYKVNALVLRGDITGAADEASGLVYTYIDLLRNDKKLNEIYPTVTLNSVARDAGSGHMLFEAGLKTKSTPGKAQGGGK